MSKDWRLTDEEMGRLLAHLPACSGDSDRDRPHHRAAERLVADAQARKLVEWLLQLNQSGNTNLLLSSRVIWQLRKDVGLP